MSDLSRIPTDDGFDEIETLALFHRYLDGVLDPDELAKINTLLGSNDRAKNLFVRYLTQEAFLGEILSQDGEIELSTGEGTEEYSDQSRSAVVNSSRVTDLASWRLPSLLVPFRTGFGGTTRQSAMVFVLGILVAALCYETWFKVHGSRERADESMAHRVVPPSPAVSNIAYLSLAEGCDWGRQRSMMRTIGSPLVPGEEVALQEGIAEFRLENGVALMVEGPASLLLVSPSTVVLQRGRFTIHVPRTVADFKVFSSACKLVGRDVEFGVRAFDDKVDVHIFSGKVRVSQLNFLRESLANSDDDVPSQSPPAQGQPELLTETLIGKGRALTLTREGDFMQVTAKRRARPDEFATKLPRVGQLPISRPYVDAVMAAKPIGYWRFESKLADGIPNEVPQGASLNVIGNVRLTGDGSNHAAELGLSDATGYLSTADPVDALGQTEYSVELWIKPNHIHSGCAAAFLAQDVATKTDNQAFFLQVIGDKHSKFGDATGEPEKIRYLHRDPPSRNGGTGVSCFSQKPYSVRRWQHVVAVKRADAANLYVDGQRVARAADKTLLAAGLRIVVGERASGDEYRRFVGQLDELAIYNHALTREEVERHYRLVDWKNVGNIADSN